MIHNIALYGCSAAIGLMFIGVILAMEGFLK